MTVPLTAEVVRDEPELRERSARFSDGIRALFQTGAVLPTEDCLKAQRRRAVIRAAAERAFAVDELDALCRSQPSRREALVST